MELVWGGFLAFFLSLLILDLSVLHRESAELSVKQALFWTAVWVSVAMSFTVVIYGLYEYRWLGFVPGPGRGAAAPTPSCCSSPATCSSGRCRSTTSSSSR